jgi:uncharacterized protein YndB with AHSA1/START domain
MTMFRWLPLALALVTPAIAADKKSPSWRDYPGVANTSFVEPGGDRVLELSAIVPASAHDAFVAFTTSKGFASWATAVAWVDLRVGGEIEASYEPKAKRGDPDNIRNRIDAYIPDRLLVIHNVQAPRILPGREAFAQTATVVSFEPLGPRSTRVTVTNVGYRPGADFDAVYKHFEWGNAYTLDALAKHFAPAATRN